MKPTKMVGTAYLVLRRTAMSNSWHGGKGSKPRPIEDKKRFEDNWDAIFAPKDKNNAKDSDSKVHTPRPKKR